MGKDWVPKKVLGKGGFGIVGHWSYEGPDPNQKPREIVVKQASGHKGGLEEEAKIMFALAATKSQHFPFIYRRLYYDKGQGATTGRMDTRGLEVHRIFLEYVSTCTNSYSRLKRKTLTDTISVP